MDRNRASRKLMESFLRLVNKYNAMEKFPLSFGTDHKFYHSERHMLDTIGGNRSMNITEFARVNGVTPWSPQMLRLNGFVPCLPVLKLNRSVDGKIGTFRKWHCTPIESGGGLNSTII